MASESRGHVAAAAGCVGPGHAIASPRPGMIVCPKSNGIHWHFASENVEPLPLLPRTPLGDVGTVIRLKDHQKKTQNRDNSRE